MQIFMNERTNPSFLRPIPEDDLALQRAEKGFLPTLWISAYSLNDKSEFNCHSGRERNQLSVCGMRG